jgi:hypothetical protein
VIRGCSAEARSAAPSIPDSSAPPTFFCLEFDPLLPRREARNVALPRRARSLAAARSIARGVRGARRRQPWRSRVPRMISEAIRPPEPSGRAHAALALQLATDAPQEPALPLTSPCAAPATTAGCSRGNGASAAGRRVDTGRPRRPSSAHESRPRGQGAWRARPARPRRQDRLSSAVR